MIQAILEKKWLRADRIWTHPLAYKSFLRLIPLFTDTWALVKSQYWSREALERMQDVRLGDLFREADHIPHWHELLSRTQGTPREILSQLQITSKSDLNERAVEEIALTALFAICDTDHTSGSTGKPFHFYQDRHDSLRSFAVVERIFRTITGGKRYPIVYVRSKERFGFTPYMHEWFYVHGYPQIPSRMEDFAKLAEKYPDGFILYGYTTWVVEIVRQMGLRKIDMPLQAVVVAGEHLAEGDKEFIEQVTGAPLFTLFASREAGYIGFECEHHAMHISEEWCLMEVVDTEGNALPLGAEGRIVVTTFDNLVMPFIRYDLGDIGKISPLPCTCGRTLRTFTYKGRISERIELGGGKVVSLLDIAYSLGRYRDAIRQYQIVQKSTSEFIFKVIPGPLFEKNRTNLEEFMRSLLDQRVHILWEVVEHIPAGKSGKAVYFVRDLKQ